MSYSKPTIFLPYYNPFKSGGQGLGDAYLSYVQDTTMAYYGASITGSIVSDALTSVGKELSETIQTASEKQNRLLGDIETTLSHGFSSINQQLTLIQLEQFNTNVLLEDIKELLKLPDSEKQRQRHLELGMKFMNKAFKREDIIDDAKNEFEKALKIMPQDWFALFQLGMAHLNFKQIQDLDKAEELLLKAAKYSSVETLDDNTLGILFNESFITNFKSTQSGMLNGFTSECYLQAALVSYIKCDFENAVKHALKAVNESPENTKALFFLAKYQTRARQFDLSINTLSTLHSINSLAYISFPADIDLIQNPKFVDFFEHLKNEAEKENLRKYSSKYELLINRFLNQIKEYGDLRFETSLNWMSIQSQFRLMPNASSDMIKNIARKAILQCLDLGILNDLQDRSYFIEEDLYPSGGDDRDNWKFIQFWREFLWNNMEVSKWLFNEYLTVIDFTQQQKELAFSIFLDGIGDANSLINIVEKYEEDAGVNWRNRSTVWTIIYLSQKYKLKDLDIKLINITRPYYKYTGTSIEAAEKMRATLKRIEYNHDDGDLNDISDYAYDKYFQKYNIEKLASLYCNDPQFKFVFEETEPIINEYTLEKSQISDDPISDEELKVYKFELKRKKLEELQRNTEDKFRKLLNNYTDQVHILIQKYAELSSNDPLERFLIVSSLSEIEDYLEKLPKIVENEKLPTTFESEKLSKTVEKKNEGCFVATAVFDDYNHPVVIDLRRFRDQYLLKKKLGIYFVTFYYKVGPIFARFIKNSSRFKKLTYVILIRPLHRLVLKCSTLG